MLGKNTICLCILVKNEVQAIKRNLSSVKAIIDHWICVDTGSTDGTQDVVRNELKDIPGELFERPWVNFGHNRTEAVKLARGKSDLILRIDADEELVITSMPDDLDGAEAYQVKYHGNPEYWLPSLLSGNRDWTYIGATHEHLDVSGAKIFNTKMIEYRHHCDGSRRPDKFQNDLALLQESYEKDKTNCRTVFYLANTLRDLGEFEQALKYYRERVQMEGWQEEVWDSALNIGICLYRLGRTTESHTAFSEAFTMNTKRAEPLYYMTKMCREKKQYALGCIYGAAGLKIPLPNAGLFINSAVYNYNLKFELGICKFYCGNYSASRDLCNDVLSYENLPNDIREATLRNRDFASDRVTRTNNNIGSKLHVFIGTRWPAHTKMWLMYLIEYMRSKDCIVEYNKIEVSEEHLANLSSKSDIVIIWNGEKNYYKPIKALCMNRNIPLYIAEVGYFPQKDFFTLDRIGINATSELMQDNLSWVTEKHMVKLEETRIRLLGNRTVKSSGYIFVPLQLPSDTNIISSSPFKNMAEFIKYLEEKFKGQRVIAKRHPYDRTEYYSDSIEIVISGDSLDYIVGADSVYGINSTVLLEAAVLGVPVEAIGDGFLKTHEGCVQTMLAALVARQIPINTLNLGVWIDPLLEAAKHGKQVSNPIHS